MLVVTIHFTCTQIIIVTVSKSQSVEGVKWVGRREECVQCRVQGTGSGGFEEVKILLTAKSNALRDFQNDAFFMLSIVYY